MVLAGGVKSKKLNLDMFLKQANEYEEWEPGWDRLSRLRTELGQTHAAPVRRVSQVMKWVRSGEYDRIMSGEYVRRGDPVSPRAEAADAADHYAERFRGFFKDADASMAKANEKVGDAGGEDHRVAARARPRPPLSYPAGAIGWLDRKMSPGSTCVLIRRRCRCVTSS